MGYATGVGRFSNTLAILPSNFRNGFEFARSIGAPGSQILAGSGSATVGSTQKKELSLGPRLLTSYRDLQYPRAESVIGAINPKLTWLLYPGSRQAIAFAGSPQNRSFY